MSKAEREEFDRAVAMWRGLMEDKERLMETLQIVRRIAVNACNARMTVSDLWNVIPEDHGWSVGEIVDAALAKARGENA